MPTTPTRSSQPLTLPFERFWVWLQAHANCILRAGTPDMLLFDHDDFHWHLAIEDSTTFVVQLARAKELVAELVLLAGDIAYVTAEPAENEEYVFECIVETETSREVAYHFVMAHDYDEAESPTTRRWTH